MRFRVKRTDDCTSTRLLNLLRFSSHFSLITRSVTHFDVIMRLARGNMADDNVALKRTEAARM
jgi:hypothetical protein